MAAKEYEYSGTALPWDDSALFRIVAERLMALVPAPGPVLEVGCGNGHTARRLHELGYDVVGVEASVSGVECAKKVLPGGRFEVATAYEDLAGRFGSFSAIVSVEVVEHLYDPKLFAQRVFHAPAASRS